MPLFGLKKRKEINQSALSNGNANGKVLTRESDLENGFNLEPDGSPFRASLDPQTALQGLPQLAFHCQLAHGSRTGLISGFSNMKQLYDKVANCYQMPASDVLFCTLNTHKVDMNKLLGGQIGLNDFIFAHCRGETKEVEIHKTEQYLGLTITDNGNGVSFIKKVKEGSLIDNIQFVKAGDHIECVNGENMVGCRHFEVAKALKDIAVGTTFVLKIVAPLRAGFSHIGPREYNSQNKKAPNLASGRETLRLRNNGPATVEAGPDVNVQLAVEKINSLLETYMGIHDNDLATQIWEMGRSKENPHDFVVAIDHSDLEVFGFNDDFVFDLWGIVTDAKAGRFK